MRISAVIPAAGKSLRFSSGGNSSHVTQRKQFRSLLSEPLIFTTLQLFLDSERIDTIVLVAQEDALNWLENQMEERHFEKEVRLAVGGERRQDSVRNGLDVVAPSSDVVVVHDAVRPFVEQRWIEETVRLCSDYDGAIVAVPVKDTLKQVSGGSVTSTIDRSEVWQAQTPQTFNVDVLFSAFDSAEEQGVEATDEAQLVEMNGGRLAIVEGSRRNIKITTQEDWEVAQAIYERKLIIVDRKSIEEN